MKSENRAAPSNRRPMGSSATDGRGFWANLLEIYALMSVPRRRQFILLLVLMLLGALAELVTIGSVLPFLSLLADPRGLERLPWAANVLEALGATTGPQQLLGATAAFAFFATLAGVIRLQLSWSTYNFIFGLGHDILMEIQRRVLLQPYSFHTDRNTSTLVSSLDKTEVLTFEVMLPLMQAVTAGFISFFIIAALIYVDPFTAAVAAATFSLIYLLVSAFTTRRLARNSATLETAYDQRLKVVQESLGGIREVILGHSQPLYLRLFDRVNSELNKARASTAFIASAPRFVIETTGMIVIAAIALTMTQREGGLAGALPILGAVALGAHRLLPLLQHIYSGWSTASGNLSVIAQVLDLARLPVGEEHAETAEIAPLPLRDRIAIENVSFAYPSRRGRTLEEVTLEIPAGSTVAVIGETGSGKSTLADLLMGLLEPTEGRITVDGVPLTRKNRRRWQRSIAHVPQSIFLADTSIARNIALAAEDDIVDSPRVMDAAMKAQLHDFVMSLPDGYETRVGERGIRLSGGQRQRLGIARAIYKQAPVLVLDEATSALDDVTEAAVLGALDDLGEEGRTIIIISHRPSAITGCDIVARLHKGRLVEVGSSAEVTRSASRSRRS